MMRTSTLYIAALVSMLGIATASQAAIVIDFEIGGAPSVEQSGGNVTVDIFLTANGATAVSGYQFAIEYVINDVRHGFDLANAPTHLGAGSWTSGGAGLALDTSTAYAAAISASTITAGDEITSADGKVKIGSLKFQVFTPAVGTNGIDVTGCYNCARIGPTGDGSVGSGDLTTTFNGAAVNIPEPATAALFCLGLLGLGVASRGRATNS